MKLESTILVAFTAILLSSCDKATDHQWQLRSDEDAKENLESSEGAVFAGGSISPEGESAKS